jgi:hypothetical protein
MIGPAMREVAASLTTAVLSLPVPSTRVTGMTNAPDCVAEIAMIECVDII